MVMVLLTGDLLHYYGIVNRQPSVRLRRYGRFHAVAGSRSSPVEHARVRHAATRSTRPVEVLY